jgi:hypothetical protein
MTTTTTRITYSAPSAADGGEVEGVGLSALADAVSRLEWQRPRGHKGWADRPFSEGLRVGRPIGFARLHDHAHRSLSVSSQE